MIEFLQLLEEPLKRPKYARELFYDFRKNRAKGSNCIMQMLFIWLRFWKEHLNNKKRCCALFLMPAVFVFVGWHFARYH